jgi:DNA-binding PadR family transcriptional regulator
VSLTMDVYMVVRESEKHAFEIADQLNRNRPRRDQLTPTLVSGILARLVKTGAVKSRRSTSGLKGRRNVYSVPDEVKLF